MGNSRMKGRTVLLNSLRHMPRYAGAALALRIRGKRGVSWGLLVVAMTFGTGCSNDRVPLAPSARCWALRCMCSTGSGMLERAW